MIQRVAVYTKISAKAQDYIRQLMELREFAESRRSNVRLWWKCLKPHPDLLNPPILNELSLWAT